MPRPLAGGAAPSADEPATTADAASRRRQPTSPPRPPSPLLPRNGVSSARPSGPRLERLETRGQEGARDSRRLARRRQLNLSLTPRPQAMGPSTPCDAAMAQAESRIAAAALVVRLSLYFYSFRCF